MKRLYLLWLYAVTLTALLTASVLTMIEERRNTKEATSRVASLASSIEDTLILNYNAKRLNRIEKLINRLRTSQRLLGIIICDQTLGKTLTFPKNKSWEIQCSSQAAKKAISTGQDVNWISTSQIGKLQFYYHPIESIGPGDPSLFVIINRDPFTQKMSWFESFIRFFISTWLGGLILISLVTTQVGRWVQGNFRILQQALLAMIAGRKPQRLSLFNSEPISKEIDTLATKILALQPPRPPFKETSSWIKSLRESMKDKNLIVIANREPYIHQYKNNKIEIIRPASGLVTALEPILRQFGGRWIAHGNGSADLDTANSDGEVMVPPGNPKYTLQRVALSREEELGYYYGFSNEGLWPLCHLAHTRPTFRLSDWEQYKTVNQRFTQAIPNRTLTDKSIILVQDYHFALMPRLIRTREGFRNSKIGIFWHIPWPNPEAFGICPWNQELLKGMLGSDIIGFHTQYHCNNFLETCNRYLEARIDWEHFSVTMDNHETFVKAFPIGIDPSPVNTLTDEEITALKTRYGIYNKWVAVGVDRLDYTKGIIERIEAVERFLEKNPEYIGNFTLVQMGSPSRTDIPAYRFLAEQLQQIVNRVNHRFGSQIGGKNYQPILFLNQHHEWEEIQYFYQIGDLCLVTSLHDGMNLVAKEYVWCQRSDRGSLILSKFTGASRELTEALIVNPYSIEELADAIATALHMSKEEKTKRMDIMKEKIEAHSAFHWASNLIRALLTKGETSSIPQQESDLQGKLQSIKGGSI